MMLVADSVTVAGRIGGISLALRPGQLTAIVGPNGAGKSTLLGCLAGLLCPEAGTITLDDAPLGDLPAPERARRIGFLPQSAEVAWDVTGETLVALGRLPWGGGMEENRAAVDAALAALDLQALRHRPVSQLSGGERARMLLARVLAGNPRWLLADEPLANLDLAHQQHLLRHLKAQALAGTGVVLVLHDLAQAMNHADQVVLLSKGHLIAEGPPRAVLTPGLISQVWGISSRWLGDTGEQALSMAQ